MNAWQKAFVKLDEANWDLWSQFEEQSSTTCSRSRCR